MSSVWHLGVTLQLTLNGEILLLYFGPVVGPPSPGLTSQEE